MVNAVHALLYAKDADKARAFFRDVLGWRHVNAGEGWLIFALPPAELGIHPVMGEDGASGQCELYLMCADVKATVAKLRAKGVKVVGGVANRGWGLVTAIQIPGAGRMGLYEPLHPVAWKAAKPRKARAPLEPHASRHRGRGSRRRGMGGDPPRRRRFGRARGRRPSRALRGRVPRSRGAGGASRRSGPARQARSRATPCSR
jgi:predicted enzyme related to lactoylglutathione lyase